MLYLYGMSGFLHRILLLASAALLLSGQMEAQPLRAADPDADSLSRYVQMKYGIDQGLVSGYQYYVRFPQYKGDPFFPEDAFFKGSVNSGGFQYDHVHLKYNSFSQSLILEYTDTHDGYNLLRLNNSHIDSFRLETFRFQKLSFVSEEPRFYQVLSSEHLTCYIHWSKDIQAINNSIQHTHVYTGPQGTYYLEYEGRILTFTNRKSFLSLFPVSMQAEIREYIKRQHFSFRKAGPVDFENLLIFISQRIETQT
jgi:hypothetical protein